MAKEPQVTVVIPNYNGRALLKNCIAALERQTCRDFCVLVVDNGSTDGSVELVSRKLELRFVTLSENTGFCGAVNVGLSQTKTPYVILLNNDTEVHPEFVGALLEAVGRSDRIFSCSAMMIDYHRRELLDNAGDYYTALGWAVARGKGRRIERYEKERDVFSACGGAMICRTEAARQLGGLDERHFAYLEDVDLGYRARIRGYRNRYVPGARVYHVGSATTGTRYNEKKVFLAARNSVYVVYKNMPLLQKLLNAPLLLAGVLVKTLFFLRKGLAGEYLRGMREGIRTAGECRRVPFLWEHLPAYLRIQWELWRNILWIVLGR